MISIKKTSEHPRWWFVRHAPVVGVSGQVYGSNDVACDTSMHDRFQRLADSIQKPDYACVSSLSRTIKTADAIRATGLSLPDYERHDWLDEQGFGEWEGRSFDEIRDITPSGKTIDGFHSFYPHFNAPGGESFHDVIERFADPFFRLHKHLGDKKNRLAVVHAGTIRAALVVCLKIDPASCQNLLLDNLGLTVLESIGSTWRCLCINHTS